METSVAARRRPGVLVATALLLALLWSTDVRPPQRINDVTRVYDAFLGDERETFIDESGQQIQMSCHPMYRWLDRLMQGMMQKVIGDVRHSRRIKTLPFKATVHVGPSETDIESMHLQDVRVARVDFTDCRTAREQSLSFLPRMLPNVIKMRVRGINVTLDFEFDTTIFGFEAQAGQARSTVVGEMNLTLALLTYDDWHVSDCSGEFAIQETHLLGDYGDTGVPVPNGLRQS